MNKNIDTAIKAAIKEMLNESGTYLHIEGVSNRTGYQLQNLLKDYSPDEKEFIPIELFFIIETVPSYKEKFSLAALQQAYCAAVKTLPIDWWSFGGAGSAGIDPHLLAIPGIDKCLKELLTDTTSLHFIEGELNAETRYTQWQRGDLAAELLAKFHHIEFDKHQPLDVRLKIRDSLKRR